MRFLESICRPEHARGVPLGVIETHLAEFKMPGAATLEAEVTSISGNGFWLLLGTEELPVPYAKFPWFKNATVEQIAAVERPTGNHLYWPKLDVNLAVESLRDPDAFPLVSGAESAE